MQKKEPYVCANCGVSREHMFLVAYEEAKVERRICSYQCHLALKKKFQQLVLKRVGEKLKAGDMLELELGIAPRMEQNAYDEYLLSSNMRI